MELDEFVFGKNAVLAYLQQAKDKASADYQNLQEALLRESLQEAKQWLQDSQGTANLQDSLETEIRQALKQLKSRRKPSKLTLPGLDCKDVLQSSSSRLPFAKVNKILLAAAAEQDERVKRIKSLARQQKIPVQSCDRRYLDQIAGPHNRHQGVIAFISPSQLWKLETFLQKLALDRIARQLAGKTMNGYMVAVLDGIEDPHNLGAIVRVAEAAGVKALFIPQRRTVGLTGTVAKTSAGALASLPVIRVSNIVHALETLKKYDFWITALDPEAKDSYSTVDLVRPLVIVIGNENKGVGKLVKEHCDFLVRIPMLGRTESLNASVAAGIFFYEVVRQCSFKP